VPWTADDLPDQHGRTVLITGATSGLGEASAVALATRGAHVILATRSSERTVAVMDRIHHRAPAASMEHLLVDLADLSSVAAAAEALADRQPRLDVVIANAGIMAPPLQHTVDGFELQMGVNHLGHFALIGQLLPLLLAATSPRVVLVSSTAHRLARLHVDDLNLERHRYQRWVAYGNSKLANLLHTLELQRRAEDAGRDLTAVAAHPGYTDTALQATSAAMLGGLAGLVSGVGSRVSNLLFAQPASQGVLPQLYAATAPALPGGSYWGPDGPGEARGYPAPAMRSTAAQDPALAAALWQASQEMTGVTYDLGSAS
jgi:NAD(P)-dependent dehydrogenase (short-subunit alcohol dehydrogenase family)